MPDTLLMGTARPLFRYVSGSDVYRYVLNNKPMQIQIPLPFPEEEILNRGVFSPYSIWKTSKGFRLNVIVTLDELGRPSVEKFLEIIESGNSFYMRPHFNFYKEYEVVCLNARSALQRRGIIVQPYQGALYFTGKENVTTHPISQGAFSFDGSTKIANTLASTLNGDCSVEMWIKTPSAFSVKEELFSMTSAGVSWTVNIGTDGIIDFITDDGSEHSLVSLAAMNTSSWYFIQVMRYSTDDKKVRILDSKGNNVSVNTNNDSKAANAITATTLAAAANGFSGLCPIYRIYNENTDTANLAHSIEAIGSSYADDIKLWWDFSQGATTDLSDEGNDGIVTGTETYSKESFPDNGVKVLT